MSCACAPETNHQTTTGRPVLSGSVAVTSKMKRLDRPCVRRFFTWKPPAILTISSSDASMSVSRVSAGLSGLHSALDNSEQTSTVAWWGVFLSSGESAEPFLRQCCPSRRAVFIKLSIGAEAEGAGIGRIMHSEKEPTHHARHIRFQAQDLKGKHLPLLFFAGLRTAAGLFHCSQSLYNV